MSTRFAAAAVAAVSLLLAGCSRTAGYEDLMDIGACSPTGEFTSDVDNPFFPLPVGHRLVLEGSEQGQDVLVRITVLDETEVVAGVETRVVEEYEEIGGRPVEVSRNFFAQAADNTVCYFGEEVDMLDASGNVTSHQGAWRAGDDGAQPGIFMPAAPEVGQAYQQEIAPGVAEDQAQVTALGEATTVPAGSFDDTVTMVDLDPLGGGRDTKVYARAVGLVVDGPARLTGWGDGG